MAHQPTGAASLSLTDEAGLFRELFETSPDGILIVDPQTLRAIRFNDAACRQLGYTREEFAGLAVTDYEAIGSADEVRARVAAVLRGGSVEFNTRHRTKNGEMRGVHVWVRTIALGGPIMFYAIHRDITDRVRMEDILRQNSELLERSQRVAHVGHWSADFRSGAGMWSDETRRIYGVGPDAPASFEAFLELVHPDDRPCLQAWADAVLAGRRPGGIEFRVVRPDGTERFIVGDGDAQFDDGGRPVAMFGTALDITERRRVTAALADNEAKFRTLFEAAQVAIFLMDRNHFLDCNRRTEELFGLSKREIVGLSPLDLSPPVQPDGRPSAERAAEHMAATLAEGPQTFSWVHLRRDGTPFDAEVSLNRIDVGGELLLQAIVRDITGSKRAAQSVRLQSAALNAAGDAIVITDRQGLIEWVNPAFTDLTGFTLGEAAGRTPGSVLGTGKHPPEFFKELWDTILAGRTWRGEIVNRSKAGRDYTESMSVTPIRDAAGTISHFVAIKEDISERLRLEAQFRQAQKMETVGHLASGIAHDFNNLLTVINGLTELMLEDLPEADRWRKDIEEIHGAGERAATLTRQLLAFSRQQILAPKVISLNATVAGLESLLRRLLTEDIEIVIALAPDLSKVKADPGQIEQVITNIAVNARDAMPRGGRLTLATRNLTADGDLDHGLGAVMPAGSYVVLEISDTGIGMDEATRTRVFEPFFTTKGVSQGTGLGLSTVYGIVKQSQGFVGVSSRLGSGTTFTVCLPRVEAAPAGDGETQSRSSGGSETILVVEDNAGLGLLTRRFLEKAGYTVLMANNGAGALEVMRRDERPVHLILTDVVMPGMNGRELADEVVRRYPATKILYMSGYTSDAIVRHGVLESTVSFLSKPFTAKALAAKVRETLDSPSPLRDHAGQ